MPKRMLIDAAHPEETRVVVTSGTRLEEFDFETSTKKQVKGNIYLAKVTRVEPSLQATFVDYGGNRHGFLAFSEIHPDYYRIPISDRPHGEAEAPDGNGNHEPGNGADSADDAGVPLAAALPEPVRVPEDTAGDDDIAGNGSDGEVEESLPPAQRAGDDAGPASAAAPDAAPAYAPFIEEWTPTGAPHPAEADSAEAASAPDLAAAERDQAASGHAAALTEQAGTAEEPGREPATIALHAAEESLIAADVREFAGDGDDRYDDERERFATEIVAREPFESDNGEREGAEDGGAAESVETLGGDEVEEVEEADAERRRRQPMRHYKIQEVIKRRQIMLVQVAKEERGNKGAALTTYLSLAGRYCVLMPNTNRGGGVSRKITSIADRRRLKDILEELDIPEGMGVIVRTAGAERSKAEIKRDYEYLLRLWNEIRELTLKSTAPALIYEEGNLIKRSIRDLYTRDIDEVLVEGEEGYKTAKAFMRTLMPSHAKRVQPYRDPQIGLFHRFQIESQIDAIHSPVVQLRSGGYVVINQTEALVAIDVNSGRSTRERNIEETALRTNLEAAEEIARQLRLRDLAGLIVIDFIDMEEHRNQVAVERRLKEALKNDRARIQVGRISPFGLLEMSRQRLRPSLAEASTQPCPHCGGTGFIRSVESTALYVLRSIEEEGIRRRSAEICIYVPTTVALYILNQKRESLNQIEARYALKVVVARDDSLIPPAFRLERLRPYGAGEAPPVRPIQAPTLAEFEEEEEEEAEAEAEAETATAAPDGEQEQPGEDERGRRRRRRRRRRVEEPREARPGAVSPADVAAEGGASAEPVAIAREEEAEAAPDGESESEAERRRRRRGRRGGRMRPRREDQREESPEAAAAAPVAAEMIEIVEGAEDTGITADAEIPAPLDTWPADFGVEAASLAPFAGEPAEPAPAGERDREHEREREPSGDRHPEAEVVPIAEAEEGVPFVSEAERELEEAVAEGHAGTEWSEPARAETARAPSPDAEAAAAQPAAPAEPEYGEFRHPAPAPAEQPVYGELAPASAAQAEPEPAEPAYAESAPPEPAPAGPSRPGEEVIAVTEKPVQPRRGWWQRMMHQ